MARIHLGCFKYKRGGPSGAQVLEVCLGESPSSATYKQVHVGPVALLFLCKWDDNDHLKCWLWVINIFYVLCCIFQNFSHACITLKQNVCDAY